MKRRGARIFYDEKGNILFQMGEATSEDDALLPFSKINKIDYIDLDYGLVNTNTHYIESIDIETNTPIVKKYNIELTEEELKMQALEKRNADLSYELMMKGDN